MTDPHFALTLNGMECADLQLHSHDPHPLLILNMFNFAFLNAFSRAGTVSFAFPSPNPTYPSLFPITAYVVNLGLFPSFVFFCVCLNALLLPPPNLPFA